MHRILDVGNCGPDHASLMRFFTKHFDCQIAQADRADDAIEKLMADAYDLVVVNRKLDIDYTDGIEVIRRMKAEPRTAEVPVMLITNYSEHQDAAVAEGALRGFGKLELDKQESRDRVAEALGA